MKHPPEHIVGVTTHARRGNIRNAFSYGVDFVLIDPEDAVRGPRLFSRNRFNLAAVYDRDHGGELRKGRGPGWARDILASNGLRTAQTQILLLTQPRLWGQVFNPVSFWLAFQDDALVAVIAEVSTPFGDRHSYLCHNPDFTEITCSSKISKPKSLHVSPFQEIAGGYDFRFDIRPDQIAIRIIHTNNDQGVVATLSGPRRPMTNISLCKAALRRPFGGLRTLALIYWQALRLKLRGAQYRTRPTPPKTEVT
ncbi:DUF1365 domain-containing protein [Loktanella sp. S4079]|uniref:DUF1365 domain-containing protein n=1 Tax=Loktanella sp. S4079 TaxID=579483 RepID=UPI0005FA8A89|nr:DUF1365 domain-containing protein [Loktanella sp. S4079]KJZ19010.1 cyclopropane-fatty-acyl-phospholipid synthase [Loktanella sp. S4079]